MGDFFKDLVYAEQDVITFPSGIPGFEKHNRFVLVQIPDYAPFEWLVCVSGPQLRFALINPLLFKPDYDPVMTKIHVEDLELEKPEDVLMFAVVTIKDNPLESTANLTGPIIINKNKRLGKQVIVDDDRYTTQEPILRKS